MTRAAWMKELIEKHKGWIGFEGMGSHIQALDYRAGTELISQVKSARFELQGEYSVEEFATD